MLIRLLAGLTLALAAFGARADIGTIDNVPAATLLIPYFEVQPTNPGGVKTIITLQNTSASAAVARVTLWTDLGLPTASFNLYLTGFDHETINLRNIFNRFVPFTADDGDDPTDTSDPNDGISNQGTFSQDINFPGIGNISADVLSASISPELLAAHSGAASIDYFGGQCGARNLGDGIARGYVTIDTMTIQTRDNHLDAAYFSGELDSRNIFVGDYVIVNPTTRQVTAEHAVPIEGSPLMIGTRTFYARFVGNAGTDRREPLPNAWAGRTSTGRTDVAYWRDPGAIVAPFACGGGPALPTGQRRVSVLDPAGAIVANPAGNLFPFVAGRTSGASLGLAQPLGWLFANLNLPDDSIQQSWMEFRQIPIDGAAGSGPPYAVPGVQLGQSFTADNPIVP